MTCTTSSPSSSPASTTCVATLAGEALARMRRQAAAPTGRQYRLPRVPPEGRVSAATTQHVQRRGRQQIVSRQWLRRQKYRGMQGGQAQRDPADLAMLRYSEKTPVCDALAAQQMQLQHHGEYQRAIAQRGPEIPNQPARRGQRQKTSGTVRTRRWRLEQLRWQQVAVHEFTLSWIP